MYNLDLFMHFYDGQSESICLFASFYSLSLSLTLSLSLSLSHTHPWYHLKTSDSQNVA